MEGGGAGQREPWGLYSQEGLVHEYGTVSPAAPWLSTWRGTAPVKRAWWGATRVRWMLGRQGQKRRVNRPFLSKMKKKAPSWSVTCFSKLIRKPQGTCHLGTYRPGAPQPARKQARDRGSQLVLERKRASLRPWGNTQLPAALLPGGKVSLGAPRTQRS